MTFGINYFESQTARSAKRIFHMCAAGLQLLESSRKLKKHSNDDDFLLGKDGVYEQKIKTKN
jgi:hypothetical protein